MPTKRLKSPGTRAVHIASLTNVYGDHRLHENDLQRKLQLRDIENHLSISNLKTVQLDQIDFKQNVDPNKRGSNCECCGGDRYENCNIKIPVIICQGIRNPKNKAYSVLDGRHRMQKMVDTGVTEAKCIVVQYDDIKEHYKPTF